MIKTLNVSNIFLGAVLLIIFYLITPNISEASHMVPPDPNDRYTGAGCTTSDDWSSCRWKITQVCSTSWFTTDSNCLSQHRAHLDSAGLAAGPPVAVSSYTTIPGCEAGSTYTGCLADIRLHCNVDPSDPGCGTGPNTYSNQLRAAYDQPIVQPPVTATICQPGDPRSVCDSRIAQWCADNNQPANVNTCISSLSNSVYSASPTGSTGGPGSSGTPPPTTGSAGSGLFGITWTNPTPFTSFSGLVTGVLNALMIIAIPIITLFIIYAGFLYVTARGNSEQVRKATNALVYALIGAVMIIGALTISTIIGNTIAQF